MARPPQTRNRFKPPQKVQAWTGVRDALENGASAPQDSIDRGGKLIGDTMAMGNNDDFGRLPVSERLFAVHQWRPEAAGHGVAPRRQLLLRLGNCVSL